MPIRNASAARARSACCTDQRRLVWPIGKIDDELTGAEGRRREWRIPAEPETGRVDDQIGAFGFVAEDALMPRDWPKGEMRGRCGDRLRKLLTAMKVAICDGDARRP